jgi:hypothetical protein
MPISVEQIQRLAGFELNALRAAEMIGEKFDKVSIPRTGTPIHDINGELLFYRLLLKRGGPVGYADIAVNEALAEPLLAVATGAKWDEKELREEGAERARKGRRGLKYDSVRFVAYSFPKLALQFLLDGEEVLLLELYSWTEVPPARQKERKSFEPSNFERWSLLDEMPKELRRTRARHFTRRVAQWETKALSRIDPTVIRIGTFDRDRIAIQSTDIREIHYSPREDDHHPCYELRGQQTGVWCVAASTEMLLNFYRYQYDQSRLAQEMGLGTCSTPNGLNYGDEYKVVDTIQKLSSNTLTASAIANPTWATFETEIQANRPLISFIPSHSRTVAGYKRTTLLLYPGRVTFRGLMVYDPWPPTTCALPEAGGVITTWENFATQTYRYAFTAVLTQV